MDVQATMNTMTTIASASFTRFVRTGMPIRTRTAGQFSGSGIHRCGRLRAV
jgi:hypothetical protein